jgi:uncharacterized protein (TIGR01777 family)
MPEVTVTITGATGLVGSALLHHLTDQGVAVHALSRRPERAPAALIARARFSAWDGLNVPEAALSGASAVVHLAGEPIFAGPLTTARRRRIRESRIESTRRLTTAIARIPESERPRCLLSASAVGIYGNRGEEQLNEDSSTTQTGFLAEVCRAWEEAAGRAQDAGLRVCALRLGLVLSRRGGALPRMLLPFRLGIGGPFGRGRNWVPWIQLDDLVGMIAWLLTQPNLSGAVNAVAPGCVRNIELSRALGAVLHRPALLPVPTPLLRGVLGELAAELLDSRRVIPARALEAGYRFEMGEIGQALARELSATAKGEPA